MIKVKDGYAKLVSTTASGSASHILLSNGGVKAVSDFAAASALDNYLPLSGGTLTGPLKIATAGYGNQLCIHRVSTTANSVVMYSNDSEVLGSIGICSKAEGSDRLYPGSYEIRSAGGNDRGVFVRYGTSSYGKFVVTNSSNTETSIGYINTKFNSTYPVWTVGAGIGGTATSFGWWYYNVGYKMYLDTSGNLYAYHFYEISDAKHKTNILTITGTDNIPILRLFDWKENNNHGYGFIAQELEELGYSELVNTDEHGEKTVNYSEALSLTMAKLQNKIQEMEKENKELRDEINNLKTNKLWQS